LRRAAGYHRRDGGGVLAVILKPSDIKKMVAEWLAAGYTADLDLSTGKVKVQPQPTNSTDADFIKWGKK
jgi:hypothetical protein